MPLYTKGSAAIQPATATVLGGVMGFSNLSIDAAGNLSLSGSNVNSALGYTPYNSTNPSGYITAAGAPVQSVFGRTGAVTLSGSDVTTALGYTPYNSTNPSGYITISSVPTAYTSNPAMNGTAAAGSSGNWSRGDHVHPTDTSRAATNQTMYIGTTGIAINRGSAALSLAGVSIDGAAGNTNKLNVQDLRTQTPTPDQMVNNGVQAVFTDVLGGTWRSYMAVHGWSSGYSSWRIIGPANQANDNLWYLQAGSGSTWDTQYQIWHAGSLTNLSQLSNGPGYYKAGDSPSFNSIAVDTQVTLTQNPVGTTYGSTGSATPPSFFGQQMGDNDNWRIYGEAASTNAGQLIIQTEDDGTEPVIFRMKMTYAPYTSYEPLRVDQSSITVNSAVRIVDSNTSLGRGSTNSLRVTTNSGWVDIGAQNSSYVHINTDGKPVYFGEAVAVNGVLSKYGGSNYANYGDSPAQFSNTLYGTNMAFGNSNEMWYNGAAADSGFFINYRGYNETTTYYRSLYIANGKNTTFATFNATNNSLTVTGDITANSSDRRLKTNFRPIDGAIGRVMRISGYIFDWDRDACERVGWRPSHGYEDDIGVVAQEVEEVLPEAVVLAPLNFQFVEDEEGNKVEKQVGDYRTVRYDKLTALLIQAVKEQQEQIDELKLRLEAR